MNIWWESCIFIDRFKPTWRGSQVSRRYKYEPYTSLYIYYIQGWFITPITIGFMLGISIVTMANINQQTPLGGTTACIFNHHWNTIKILRKIPLNPLQARFPGAFPAHLRTLWAFEELGATPALHRGRRCGRRRGSHEALGPGALRAEWSWRSLTYFLRKMWENCLAIMNVGENWSINTVQFLNFQQKHDVTSWKLGWSHRLSYLFEAMDHSEFLFVVRIFTSWKTFISPTLDSNNWKITIATGVDNWITQ